MQNKDRKSQSGRVKFKPGRSKPIVFVAQFEAWIYNPLSAKMVLLPVTKAWQTLQPGLQITRSTASLLLKIN